MTVILDGKKASSYYDEQMINRVEKLKADGIVPGLAVILVGNDPASEIYVRNKGRRAEKVGVNFRKVLLPEDVSEAEVLHQVELLNQDDTIDGFIVQLPLPDHISEVKVIDAIAPDKDVDGFSPYNSGHLYTGSENLVPATAKGIMMLLDFYDIEVQGKNVVVMGSSNIVGRPVSAMMLNAGASIALTNKNTNNIKTITNSADILVVAIGQGKYVDSSYVKDGAIVLDVGTDHIDGKLVGDVDYDDVFEKVDAITPVPGGVGPMTITGLIMQTIELAEKRAMINE